jgi:hypothetical protein
MPRFVVLKHIPPAGSSDPVHWDFMLEHEGVLLTWALASPPDTPGPISARKLKDHRLAYLDYEGEISGNRGSVSRWDEGTFEAVVAGEVATVLCLEGRRFRGEARQSQATSPVWIFTPNRPAD